MNRAQKTAQIDSMAQAFRSTPHVILATQSGLTVNQSTELRRRIRRTGGRYAVIKNRLAKRAAAGTACEGLARQFSGPCGIAMHPDDPVALAKALTEFSKENPQLALVAGLVDARDLIDTQGVKHLASLPGLPELRAQLLALIQTPATMLTRLIGTPSTQVARAIDARREKLEGGA